MSNISERLFSHISSDNRLNAFSRLGDCRRWTFFALKSIKPAMHDLSIVSLEARLVTLSPGHDHTFIRAKSSTESPLLLDGVGTGLHGPFFGDEDEAPPHLKNSVPDTMINILLGL